MLGTIIVEANTSARLQRKRRCTGFVTIPFNIKIILFLYFYSNSNWRFKKKYRIDLVLSCVALPCSN